MKSPASWSCLSFALAASSFCWANPLPTVLPQKTPAPSAHHESGVPRLKSLVQKAEDALEKEDFDTASDCADEAETLMAAWGSAVLKRSDIAALIARLQAVQRQLEIEEITEEGGLVGFDEDINLTPDQLRAEREHVLAAGGAGVFDFPIDLNDKVLLWVNVFTGRIKAKIEASLSRGSSYLPMIRQIFEEEGVPQDLAFLPLIESGYINKIKSYASAMGMWQFMPSTGRLFGLTQNAWVDERRDPTRATRAAARYLKQLYQSSGDWYLALAGYNNGPGRVESAADIIGSRNFWDIARSRHMRDQTKSYVPQFCAAVLVGRYPEKYGLKVEQQKPYAFETVEIEKPTSLATLAKYAGMDIEALKLLNPELLRGVTPPGKYQLRVPPGQALITSRALVRIPSVEQVQFRTYVIRKRDTLAKVADHFNLSQEDLLQANDLSRSQFRVGRRIQIPPPVPDSSSWQEAHREAELATRQHEVLLGDSSRVEIPLAPVPSTPGREKAAPQVAIPAPGRADLPKVKIPKAPVVAESAKASPRQSLRFHVVKPGETIYSIASRYGVDIRDLKKLNGVRGSSIFAGQKLKIHK